LCVVPVAASRPATPDDHVAQIFDPFFTTKATGNGLGLFIARQIMAEHGGRIAPVPRDGGGTVFSIHLPADAGEGGAGGRAGWATPSGDAASARDGGGRRPALAPTAPRRRGGYRTPRHRRRADGASRDD